MRVPRLLVSALFVSMAAGAAQAADERFTCEGQAEVPPGPAASLTATLTVEGGLMAPTGATYAWDRPEAPVPTKLTGLLGDTLQFHGMAPGAGGVGVADIALDRKTLALTLKTKIVGGAGQAVTLQTTCRPG